MSHDPMSGVEPGAAASGRHASEPTAAMVTALVRMREDITCTAGFRPLRPSDAAVTDTSVDEGDASVDEGGAEEARRTVVDLERGSDLFHTTLVEDGDPVPARHRLVPLLEELLDAINDEDLGTVRDVASALRRRIA